MRNSSFSKTPFYAHKIIPCYVINKVDSINLYYPPQAKQLSEIFKVMQIPHIFFIDLIYGRPSKAHYWQKILGFNDGVHFFSELPLGESSTS